MSDLLPWLAVGLGTGTGGGLVLGLARIAYRMHKDAVDAERGRADDWRTASSEWRAVALERDRQVNHIVTGVSQTTTGQSP